MYDRRDMAGINRVLPAAALGKFVRTGVQIDGTANPELGHRLKRRPVTRPAAFVKTTEEFDPTSTGTEAGETM